MALTRRMAPTGSPTVTTTAAPDYSATGEPIRASSLLQQMTVQRAMPETALLTGTIAVPRSTPRDSSGALLLSPEQTARVATAQGLAADQRVQRYGLPEGSREVLLDYYREVGRFPDLEQFAAGGGAGNFSEGGVLGSSGPTLAGLGGMSMNLWILLSIGGLALLLLSKRKG